ncbi:hypothetical protein FGO68_gene11835 [Halteria grandinella]|uniref:WD40 repeat-containing protein n=1 Tax=Halteria grandinella TaxID=5974 RepID=A0A8J8NVL0_HALGN|nr:hypothetical protein FGO68_gene11835 [Halteria grandinella]
MNKQQVKKGLVTLFAKKSQDFNAANSSKQLEQPQKTTQKQRSTSRGRQTQLASFDNSKQPKQFQSITQDQKIQGVSRQQQLVQSTNFKSMSQKQVQRPQTQIAASRHNEYNNNEEDYSKATKEEMIQHIFTKRKHKMLSMGSPHRELPTAKGFDGLVMHHQHNMSQQPNIIDSKLLQQVQQAQRIISSSSGIERNLTPPPIQQFKQKQQILDPSKSAEGTKKQSVLKPEMAAISIQSIKSASRIINAQVLPAFAYQENSKSQQLKGPNSERESQNPSSTIKNDAPSQIAQNMQINKTISVKVQQPHSIQHQYSFDAHNNTITGLEIDQKNPSLLFSSSFDYSVKFWDLSQPKIGASSTKQQFNPIHKIINSKRQRINSLMYSQDSSFLYAAQDKAIKVYDTKNNGNQIITINGQHRGLVQGLCQIGNQYIASICSDLDIRIFSLQSQDINTPVNVFSQEESSPNNICALSALTFVTSGIDRGVRLWDMRQNSPAILFKTIHYDQITSLERLSSTVFATASNDGHLNLWDIRMEKLQKQIRFENDSIGCVKFIKSQYLVVAHNKAMTLLSLKDSFSLKLTTHFEQQGTVKAMCFSDKEKNMYTAGTDGKINAWQLTI